MTTSNRAVHAIRRAVFPIFFASGACALVYQVVWTRQPGLALGSWWLGRVADRVRRPVRLYGLLEAGIGVYTLLFPWLLDHAVRPLFMSAAGIFEPASAPLQAARFAIAVGALIVPTTLMGGTFPVMSRFFVRLRERVGRDLSLLYAVNTVGAVGGTILVGFVLLAFFGIRATLYGTALVNLALAAAAIRLSRREPRPVRDDDAGPGSVAAPLTGTSAAAGPAGDTSALSGNPRVLRLCLVAILLSGFASLAYEVLWTRVLLFYLHNSTFAFSAMLATFLFGLTAGSWLVGLVLDRIQRLVSWFGWLEIALAVSVALSAQVIRRLPELVTLGLETIGLDSWWVTLFYIFGQTALVLLIPALILGAIFPLATRIYTTGLGSVGRKVGTVYSANTLGAIFGAAAAGFVMIPTIGVRGSFLALILLNFLLGTALLGMDPDRGPRAKLGAVVAVLVLALLSWTALPAKIFYRNFEKRFGQVLFYEEEASDTIMVAQVSGRPATRMMIFSDGRGTAGTPTVMENRFYGHLPLLLHPEPKEVLVICFGVGNTMGAIGRHPEVERIDVAELSPGVVKCAPNFPTNNGILEDPRVNLTIEDGRNFLLTTDKKYDVITLEPPEIHTAGVVNLYTREFYELCRDHLKEGGVLSHWVNVFLLPEKETRMLVRTVLEIFPHTTLWQGPRHYSFNFISSERPLSIELSEFRRKLAQPEVNRSLAEVQLADQYDLLSLFLFSEQGLDRFAGDVPVVTDDHSRIDFSVPRSVYSGFGFKHPFSAHVNVLTETHSDHDPEERGGRLGLMLLSLGRESVAPLVTGRQGPPAAEAGAGELPSFDELLEARIEKRREIYRTLIKHDPDRAILDAWGVSGEYSH